jgi:hypothetical protein
LAKFIDEEVAALQRKSPAVRKESASLFAQYRALCRESGVSDYPISPIMIAAWLHEEAMAGASYAKLKKCSAAAAYFHRVNGLPDPTEHVLARAVLSARRRQGDTEKEKVRSWQSKRPTLKLSRK